MKIVKKIILAILSLAICAGVIFLAFTMQEEMQVTNGSKFQIVPSKGGVNLIRNGGTLSINSQSELETGDEIVIPAGENAVVQTSKNAVVRLDSDTKLSFISDESQGEGVLFELSKGRVWVNGAYTTENINLIAGGSFIISRKGAFDTMYDGLKTNIKVFTNQVTVGLIKPGIKFTKAVRFASPQFINSFLMAQGSQANIYLAKISDNVEVLKKLLYSKLVKEFQYNLFDKQAVMSDPWIRQNIDEDSLFSQKVTREKAKVINARGLKIASLDSIPYKVQKAVEGFADVLTFSSGKVLDRSIERIFDNIYDSEYLFVYERETEAKERLALFADLIRESLAADPDRLKEPILNKLREIYSDLAYVMPEDHLFEVKTAVADQIGLLLGVSDEDLIEKFSLIRAYMNYAYVLADSNSMLSRLMLDQYDTKFTAFVEAEKNYIKRIKNVIAEENQVMDFLLKQYSIFYNDAAFALKHKLETQWLGMLPEGNDKNEERQTIASNKIDYLKNIQAFCLDEKVGITDADKVVSRLIVDIKDLDTGSELGISQLFALRLKDYGQFLMFLKTAQSKSLKGANVREKYESFLAMQTEQVLIDEAIKDYLKDSITTAVVISPEQILVQIKGDFDSAGVSDLELGSFAGVDQSVISVESASYENKIFSGQYDWGKKLISDVRSGGNLLSEKPVRLDALRVVLNPKEDVTSVETQAHGTTQQQTIEATKAEKISRVLVIQKLKKMDMAVAESNIWIVDLATGSFIIENANLISRPEVIFTFNLDNKANLASGVNVHTGTGDLPLDGTVSLTALPQKVLEIFTAPADAENEASENI
jgi:hypothetical protein